MTNVIYFVEHVYERDNEEEIKFIGVFSSIEKAYLAIDELIDQPGFRNFPRDCFQVTKGLIDRIAWKEGFGV